MECIYVYISRIFVKIFDMDRNWIENQQRVVPLVWYNIHLVSSKNVGKRRNGGERLGRKGCSVCSIVSASKQHANFTSNTNILPANKLSTYFTLEEHCRRSTKFRDKLII